MQQPVPAWATTLRDAMRSAEAEANAVCAARILSAHAEVGAALERLVRDYDQQEALNEALAAIAVLEAAYIERAQRIVSEARRLVAAVPLNRRQRRGLNVTADTLCAKVTRSALDPLGSLTVAKFKARHASAKREDCAVDQLWSDLLTEALENTP